MCKLKKYEANFQFGYCGKIRASVFSGNHLSVLVYPENPVIIQNIAWEVKTLSKGV
jgi:hypothetical protein